MNKSEQVNEIAAALAKAQGAMENARKDSENPHFRSKYADLASIVDAIKRPLAENGIAYVQTTIPSEKQEVRVVTTLVHTSGQWLQGELAMPVQKADAQGFGSAMTYCRRYSLAAIAGIAPDDDDGNAAAQAKPSGAVPLRPQAAKQVAVDAFDALEPEEQDFLRTHAAELERLCGSGGDMAGYIDAQRFDNEEKLALWSLLPSNVRSAIKKQQGNARAA